MNYKELKINLPKEITEEFNEFLDELEVEGYYEILFDSSLPKIDNQILRDDTNIKVYIQDIDLMKEVKIQIYLSVKAAEKFFIESRNIETKEYEEAYKEFYKPFQIGKNFWIVPVWEKNSSEISKNSSNQILYMNPGLAFGTGHHETTKLMLKRMQDLNLQDSKILDLGCGSGILSIGAFRLGAKKVFALDIDSNATRATEFNFKENQFPNEVELKIIHSGIENEEIFQEKFNLVLANITFAVFSQNIQFINKIKSNEFLFSGLIVERKEDSLKLFREHLGGELVYLEELNDWLLIQWKKTR